MQASFCSERLKSRGVKPLTLALSLCSAFNIVLVCPSDFFVNELFGRGACPAN